jgi:carbonic anhydrase/acetyltransferase-like protein (isoleucine patch superfamily)
MQATLLPPRNPALCAPITSNRELGACLIANLPMRELLEADLRRAGLQLVEPEEATARTLRIPLDNWIELGALLMLGRTPNTACLLDSEGAVLAWKGSENPDECEDRITTDANCFPVIYPWDLLRMNEEVLALMDETSLLGEVSPLASLSGCVRLAHGSKILPGTVIEGPVIIGPNSQIGPNAYVRGATSIGSNCFVGNGAEVKNSIIYNNSYISRQCYVGDSIIGTHVTLGAGTCTENHRHDGRHHVSMIQGNAVNTGRLKFGAILGDGVRTGVNTSLEAGVKIGVARTTQAGSYIGKDLL